MGQLIELGQWNGVRIRCNPADQGYFHATDMAKSEQKKWHDFFRLESTQRYLGAWRSAGYPADPIIIVKGGQNAERGTWIHRRLAIRFAQWLNEEFSLWIDERIEELMMRGHTSLVESRDDRHTQLLEQTLHEVKEQRQENREILEHSKRTNDLSWEIIRSLQHAPANRIEREATRQLQKQIGGYTEVPIKNGMWKVDLLTDKEAIEVKLVQNWKHAIGQIKTVSKYLDQDLRIHLFWRPMDKPTTAKRRAEIEHEAFCQGIRVTWHEWQLPSGDHQNLLFP